MKIGDILFDKFTGKRFKIETLNIGAMANTGFVIDLLDKKRYFYKRFNNITLKSEEKRKKQFETHQNHISKIFNAINENENTAHSFPTTISFFGDEKQIRYLKIMERLKGQDLSDYIKTTHAIEQTFAWIAQFLYVMNEMHKRGIVHCDLKPENVFIKETDDGKKIVQLIDIEDVIFLKDRIYPLNIVGSTLWYSPEHRMIENGVHDWSIKDITTKSDVFTICGMIQYLITRGNLENLKKKMGLVDYFASKGKFIETFELLKRHKPKDMIVNQYDSFCNLIDKGLSFDSDERPTVFELRANLMKTILYRPKEEGETRNKGLIIDSINRIIKYNKAVLTITYKGKSKRFKFDNKKNELTLLSILPKVDSKFNLGVNLGRIRFLPEKSLLKLTISPKGIEYKIFDTTERLYEIKPKDKLILKKDNEDFSFSFKLEK